MSVRRGHAGKVDGNQAQIVDALRKAGISASSIAQVGGGVPDILCGFRGLTMLIEAKMPGRGLTKDEEQWHATWSGHVAIAQTPEEAVLKVIEYAKDMGRL